MRQYHLSMENVDLLSTRRVHALALAAGAAPVTEDEVRQLIAWLTHELGVAVCVVPVRTQAALEEDFVESIRGNMKNKSLCYS
jgi:hypothetical protein